MSPFASWSGGFGAIFLSLVVLIAVLAPWLSPYDPLVNNFDAAGQLRRLAPPSAAHLLGTTYYGLDVLSQLIHGTRIVLIVGITCAVLIALIGTNIGLIAGYYGGRVDTVLMRATDLAFGVPFIPFAVVLVALLGPSLWNTIIAISFLMWRSTARVIRSQVLSLRERGFVKAARIAGASDMRILYVHIFPNVLPMALLYVSFDIAWAVLAEASISFLGFGDPHQTSWGQMLYLAYVSGSIRQAWWWTVPPGAALSLFVIAVFLVGREYERLANPRLR
ncbi:ABC transporter permease [Elioraea sp.]|uniref:ABC transporter permease n=1 Tax=Elioraea sp. TaxID=2185103 RepID=UPI0025C0E350|nr:ABC transporter permease [Elioraea sp.]